MLAVSALTLALAAAGCGGQDDTKLVRAKLRELADATARKDYQRLCDQVFAQELIAKVKSVGLPCEVALETGLRNVLNPTLTVQSVDVNGGDASARVRSTATGEAPSTDTITLVKEKAGWRVSSLAGAQAPHGKRTPVP
jgi:hypothetical protein